MKEQIQQIDTIKKKIDSVWTTKNMNALKETWTNPVGEEVWEKIKKVDKSIQEINKELDSLKTFWIEYNNEDKIY